MAIRLGIIAYPRWHNPSAYVLPRPPPQVMELLRLLVKAGPNSDLKRLLFSNFSFLLSFLEMDAAAAADAPSPSQQNEAGPSAATRSAGVGTGREAGRSGGRRLYFASPVARLMGAVIDGDYVLVTSISDDHLAQLAMAATRSRYDTTTTLSAGELFKSVAALSRPWMGLFSILWCFLFALPLLRALMSGLCYVSLLSWRLTIARPLLVDFSQNLCFRYM